MLSLGCTSKSSGIHERKGQLYVCSTGSRGYCNGRSEFVIYYIIVTWYSAKQLVSVVVTIFRGDFVGSSESDVVEITFYSSNVEITFLLRMCDWKDKTQSGCSQVLQEGQ